MPNFPLNSKGLPQIRINVFAFASLTILLLILYSNTFDVSWHFDDEYNILKRKAVHMTELSWEQVKRTFYDDEGRIYRPAANLSFALNYYAGQKNVQGYHLVNLIIHMTASVFLFLFVYETLNLPKLQARYGPNSYSIALLSAVLWAVNPVQTQAVTYIVQRMAGMAGMFFIMSMYFFLKCRTSMRRLPFLAYACLSVVSALLAFGSKLSTAMLPFSLLVFDLILIQGINRKSIKRCGGIGLVLVVIPFLLLFIAKGNILDYQRLFSTYGGYRDFNMIERLMTESRVLFMYISLLIYPMPDRLNLAHHVGVSRGLLDPPTTILAVSGIFAFILTALLRSNKWPLISFSVLFFFLNHLVESSIWPLELVFEHRNYIPSMLFFVPIAVLLVRGVELVSYRPAMKGIFTGFIVLMLIGIGHGTFIRNAVWKTEESLWLDCMDKSPELPRVHLNLGRYYDQRGMKKEALEEYKKAIRLPRGPDAPVHYLTNYNIGLIYCSMEDFKRAEGHFRRAVDQAPGFGPAHTMLGVMRIREGRYYEALDHLKTAVTYNPEYAPAHAQMAFILLKKGLPARALDEAKKAVEQEPDNIHALACLGLAYKALGEYDQALAPFQKVLSLNGNSMMNRLYLIEVNAIKGQPEEAGKAAIRLLNHFPIEALTRFLASLKSRNPAMEPPDMSVVKPFLIMALGEKEEKGRGHEDLMEVLLSR